MNEMPAPVAAADRIETIDVVRGFALLGILLLNIIGFGMPFEAYSNPTVDGATSGINLWVFGTVDFLFEGVLRALFSMLFGAGVVIFALGKVRVSTTSASCCCSRSVSSTLSFCFGWATSS